MPIVDDVPAATRPAKDPEELDRRLLLQPRQSGTRGEHCCHGRTCSGHPTACAVALANLDLSERADLVARAGTIRQSFRGTPGRVQRTTRVGEVRVAGATVGVELVVDHDGQAPLMAGSVAAELCRTHRVSRLEQRLGGSTGESR